MSKSRKSSKSLVISEDEMINSLNRSLLPTILVEGSDEKSVYRYLESKINIENVDILPCNGRDMLLRIFKRRQEFQGAKVVFVADKDMWFFVGIPEEYKDEIVFTDGYSLENDLYIKTFFEGLLNKNETESFQKLIEELSIWFAFEVNKYIQTNTSSCNYNISQICPEPENVLCESFKIKIGFVEPPRDIIQMISEDYTRALRGKNLFDALIRFLSYSKRESKFSRPNIIELGAKNENPRVTVLINTISEKFKQQV